MYLYRAQITHRHRFRVFAACAILFAAIAPAYPQTALSSPPPSASLTSTPAPLTSTQIVDEMLRHNLERADALKHYQSVRHYEVEYKGYSARIGAKLVVEADYDAISGKTFRVLSQSGSRLLVDKVLKRLLDTEKDAARDQNSTALTPANYKFRLAGIESLAGRPAYILEVEPFLDSKYLYRGRIWVDAADFAV